MTLSRCVECGAELQLAPKACPLCGAEVTRETASLSGWEVDRYQAEVRRLRGELEPTRRKPRRLVSVKSTEKG